MLFIALAMPNWLDLRARLRWKLPNDPKNPHAARGEGRKPKGNDNE
jgi:hypothetical protein